MLKKFKFVTIMEGAFCKIINVNVVSQCNGCHHTMLDVVRRLTFISGKSTKRGVNYY
jgi:hypothetical protein